MNAPHTSCCTVGCFDELGCNPFAAGDEDNAETLGGLASYNEVITEHAIGDLDVNEPQAMSQA